MNEESKTPMPAEAPVEEPRKPEPGPVARIELQTALRPVKTFWPRIFLYGAALVVALGYFWTRGNRMPRLQPVFLNADRIVEIRWSEENVRLYSTGEGWRVEHPVWGSAPAEEGRVDELLQRIREARGMPVSRVPEGAAPVGRMEIRTDKASRVLSWRRLGSDGLVESGSQAFVLPGFSVDALFPDPVDLAQRRPVLVDVSAIVEITLPVLTAEGEKRYRIRKEGTYYYISGPQIHLVNYNTIISILKNIQDFSFRRLLPPPPDFPASADLVLSTADRTWRLARFEGPCPPEESAWVVDAGEKIAGCVPARLKLQMTPSLPALLEPRLLPPPFDGRSFDRIRVRAGGKTVVDVRRTPRGWVFPDGAPADGVFCGQVISAWQDAVVLGMADPDPAASSLMEVVFSAGDLDFPVALHAAGGELYAARWKEGRWARILPAMGELRADPAWWADRRLFPGGCRHVVRTAGAFREVFHLEEPEGGAPVWRVLEPLDAPYPVQLEERIGRLCALRALPPDDAVGAPAELVSQAVVRWEVTGDDGRAVVLAIRPDGLAVREEPGGRRTPVRLEDFRWLVAYWHNGMVLPWDVRQVRGAHVRFDSGREARLEFREPHWLWTDGEKKRILTAGQVQAFLQKIQEGLEQAQPEDLQDAAGCAVRMEFFSDAGLPAAYCLDAAGEHRWISRVGLAGRAVVPADFPESVFP